jgi:hypothetical protein
VSRFRLRARLGFSIPLPLSGPRGITPAFGYGAPHPSARGTSTPLNNALLSAHYGAVRLLLNVHVRRSVYGLRGPVLVCYPRRPGDLPVLVHVVSQRAQVLRLRRTETATRVIAAAVLPSSHSEYESASYATRFSKLNSPAPLIPLSTLQATPRDVPRKTRGQDGFAVLLSCRALSSPTTCRFIPAHVAVGTTIADRPPHRSVQARLRIRLLRRMSGVEACIGIGVQNSWWRNPAVQDWGQTFPTHLCALTTAD